MVKTSGRPEGKGRGSTPQVTDKGKLGNSEMSGKARHSLKSSWPEGEGPWVLTCTKNMGALNEKRGFSIPQVCSAYDTLGRGVHHNLGVQLNEKDLDWVASRWKPIRGPLIVRPAEGRGGSVACHKEKHQESDCVREKSLSLRERI